MGDHSVHAAYRAARDGFGKLGVDTEAALSILGEIPLSLPCWQCDDVAGLEGVATGASGGGIAAIGGYPGRARNGDEVRADLTKALSLIPGRHKASLHASYAEDTGGRDRDALTPADFSRWIDWARALNISLDFNPTFFAHRLADGATLSSPDESVRGFWIAHALASRRIAGAMAEATGRACVNNLWIPDGSKDDTLSRMAARARLMESLDAVYEQPPALDGAVHEAVESKLFGLGSEAFVVGSHEFYLGYAMRAAARGTPVIPTLDLGHFHPTEQVSDKISSLLLFHPALLLHISRGVRWDSDHVPVLSDDLRRVMQEIVRADALRRVFVGLDFFDASINRVGALVIGARAVQKALLAALLEPRTLLREAEESGNFAARLALLDEAASAPVGVVYDEFCLRQDCSPGSAWLDELTRYEREVQAQRAPGGPQ